MKLKSSLAILLIVAAVATVHAQEPKKQPPVAGTKGDTRPRSELAATELVERNFFAPELVMKHQGAIELTADQQQSIRADMQTTMARFTELQWQQGAETETMLTLVAQEHPNEKAVLAQLDKLLSIENEIKRLRAGLLVRIKNSLTPEQQARLRRLTTNKNPGTKTLETKSGK